MITAGMTLLQEYEGLKLTAYPDPGTGGEPYTIGYGSTGPNVKKGMKITQEEAEKLLEDHLHTLEKQLAAHLRVKLNENQFAALVCLAYNIGLHGVTGSKLFGLVNDGHFHEAADHFLLFNKANGKILPGLTKRREAERSLFLKP